MKKLLFVLILYSLFLTKVFGANASWIGGECRFINSIHYEIASTYCMQTLNFEEVETDFLYFTILDTGEVCEVYEIN